MFVKFVQNLRQELNDFLSSTSIHGLPYLAQSRSTRIIWTILVAAALTSATVFLVQTVGDWSTKHITTTMETQSVERFPFPAVTFFGGDFSSKKAFLRAFLNQFQMTRYDESSPLYDNKKFTESFKKFVNIFDGKSLFYWVENYLLEEEEFVREKGSIFRQEVCSLVSLLSRGETNLETLRTDIADFFNLNIYKFRGFKDIVIFMRKELSPKITEMIEKENVTKSEMNSLCRAKETEATKREVESLLLSYLYAFMDPVSADVGFGDLATERFFQLDADEIATELFNDMSGGSLPGTLMTLPHWFLKPNNDDMIKLIEDKKFYLKPLPSSEVTELANLRYKYFWTVFNAGAENLFLMCTIENCGPEDFFFIEPGKDEGAKAMLEDEKRKHKVKHAAVKVPPCRDEGQAREFGFQSICDIKKNVSANVETFLKVVKFTKQSPTFLESEQEYLNVFGSLTGNEKYGFYPISKQYLERHNAFVSLCKFEGKPKVMSFSKCDLFRRSFTNKGLGFTFNNLKADKLFKRKKILATQINNLQMNQMSGPLPMTNAGPSNALSVIIENNIEEIEFFQKTKQPQNPTGEMKFEPTKVDVVLHDPSEPANMRLKSLEVPLGQSSKVYITPTATVTDATGRALSQDGRHCRLREETRGLKVFQTYSREACVLECQLSQAVQRCGCHPWDYPIITEQESNFCDAFGYICFEEMMENNTVVCDCPMDCDSVQYSYSIVSTPMTEEKECPTNGKDSDFEEFYKKPFPPKFVLRAREFMKKTNSSRVVDHCKQLLRYRAKVTFRLATDTVSVTVRSRRLSFFDKLSGFGKQILGIIFFSLEHI